MSTAGLSLDWSTDSTGPARFVSVHGRRAAVFGYSNDGLEVWVYPFQIVDSLRISFREPGTTTEIDGQRLLRRIVYSPESVARIYVGPDFIVREKLFVPLDEAGAVITYEVEGPRQFDVIVRFVPVLDLMWPGSIGGQDVAWSDRASAYVLSEPLHRFTASVGSPDIGAHDETANNTRSAVGSQGLAVTISAGTGKMGRLIIGAASSTQNLNAITTKLLKDAPSLKKSASDHYAALLDQALRIETPDADVNRALVWSEIALDQAWVCNSGLGCGLVAGYGPSRKARRPQYDWFFAGDGMVALRGLLAAGEYKRARDELEFILKYQDQKNGMIWHELSQSAGWLDWSKYPYMFVHVDLTFDFLNAVADYFHATGDSDFLKTHWEAIQSAYRYCSSLVDANNGLPLIPAEKMGEREQDPLGDELALSAAWVFASRSFADLATASGRSELASQALLASERAKLATGRRYWDTQQGFAISGYTRSGQPFADHGIGAARLLGTETFSPAQRSSVLDRLASTDFQADWGTRGRASSAGNYAPNSYASGSVWATGTVGTSMAFWAEHRPATAFPIWRALVPWSSLDSLGHMHEALAGDFYHEEMASVPEQTWSSATFLSAAVHGLLGIQVDALTHRLSFAPHLPPDWNEITVQNIRVGASTIRLKMAQSTSAIRIDMHNDGPPVSALVNPEIPLGARLRGARFEDRPLAATLEQNSQDTHARVELTLPRGDSSLRIDFSGGVAVTTQPPTPAIGEASRSIKMTAIHLNGREYTIDFDYLPSSGATFDLYTPWKIQEEKGVTMRALGPDNYRLTVDLPAHSKEDNIYQHGQATLTFARDALH